MKTDDELLATFTNSTLGQRAGEWRSANGVLMKASPGTFDSNTRAGKTTMDKASKLDDDQWFFGTIGIIDKIGWKMKPPVDATISSLQRPIGQFPVYNLPKPADVHVAYRLELSRYGKILPPYDVWAHKNKGFFTLHSIPLPPLSSIPPQPQSVKSILGPIPPQPQVTTKNTGPPAIQPGRVTNILGQPVLPPQLSNQNAAKPAQVSTGTHTVNNVTAQTQNSTAATTNQESDEEQLFSKLEGRDQAAKAASGRTARSRKRSLNSEEQPARKRGRRTEVVIISDDDNEDDGDVKTEAMTSAFHHSSLQPAHGSHPGASTSRTTSENVLTNAAAVANAEHAMMAACLAAQKAYGNGCDITKIYGDYEFTIKLEKKKE